MAEVKVLIQGWTNADSLENGEEENDACTTSLIIDGDINAIVDPGIVDDNQTIINALNKEGLALEDITHIFLTHSHIDHYRSIGIFPAQTPVVEFYGQWTGNKVTDWAEEFTRNIKIIKTPGHSLTGLSFLVDTDKGKVAIVGDVFWKKNEPINDPYADNPEELSQSRQKILKQADYVIPGHGDIYKVVK